MLKTLLIKNIALIENQIIEFGDGLNVITGETGAGKSIIIGAIKLIRGDKSSSKMVREGFDKGIVEATFQLDEHSNSDILKDLIDKGFDIEDNFLICRCEISADDKSRVFINMQSCTKNYLKQITEQLIDISGQHDHQSLLKVPIHIELLDEFAGLHNEVNELENIITNRNGMIEKLNEYHNKQNENEKKIDYNKYAINEIDEISPTIDEDKHLISEIDYLNNYQKIISNTNNIYENIYDGNPSALSLIENSIQNIENIENLNKSFLDIKNELRECVYKLENVQDMLRKHTEIDDFSMEHLEELNLRLTNINKIKKKYGGSIEEILKFKENAQKELEEIDTDEGKYKTLEKEIDIVTEQIKDMSIKLSRNRRVKAKTLDEKVQEEISYLGMQQGKFITEFRYIEVPESYIKISDKPIRISQKGIDYVEFTFSANQGESPKPLSQIASGGELSRVMLALKLIFSQVDKVPTLILDEIDTGIGGQISSKVGKKIKQASDNRQIICITHSPQIASIPAKHMVVIKNEEAGRTITKIHDLKEENRINEIARMLGGENITDTTIQHAKELIQSQL